MKSGDAPSGGSGSKREADLMDLNAQGNRPPKGEGPADWSTMAYGIGCPFCAPSTVRGESWIRVESLRVSTLYLDRNQTYRGHSVLVFDPRHAVGIESLTPEEFGAMTIDLRTCARALVRACNPDHMNYASLGNEIPHLHWHLVPRYRTDPRWGGPISTTTTAEMTVTRLDEKDYLALVDQIRAALSAEESRAHATPQPDRESANP